MVFESEMIKVFNDLTVKIGSRTLLASGTLEVQRGTITVLMGPSGAGKSLLSDLVFNIDSRGGGASKVVLSQMLHENVAHSFFRKVVGFRILVF